MTEWGVRLDVPGSKPDEFKVPKGENAARVYVAGFNASSRFLLFGEKATVVTRAKPSDPWKAAR